MHLEILDLWITIILHFILFIPYFLLNRWLPLPARHHPSQHLQGPALQAPLQPGPEKVALQRHGQPVPLRYSRGEPGGRGSDGQGGDLRVLVGGRGFPPAVGQLLREGGAAPGEHHSDGPLAHASHRARGDHHPAGWVPLGAGAHQDVLERADRGVRPAGLLPRGLLPVRHLPQPRPHEVHAEAGRVPQHAAEEAEDRGQACRELTPKREHHPRLYVRSQGLPDAKRQLHLQHAHPRVLARQQQELLRGVRQAAAQPEGESRRVFPDQPSAQGEARLGDQRLHRMREQKSLPPKKSNLHLHEGRRL